MEHTIYRLKRESRLRQVKYLNNAIGSDHASIKKLIETTGGLKVRKRAWSIIQGFEGIRIWLRRDKPKLRVQERAAFRSELFNLFGIYAWKEVLS